LLNDDTYLKGEIKKKKSSIYLIANNQQLSTNVQEDLFVTSKWKIKALLNRFLPIFSLFSTYFEPQLIVDQIARELELTKNHKSLHRNLESVLDLLKALSTFDLKVEVYGRFNASTRSQKKYISCDNFPINTYKHRVNYAFAHSYARIGCFGIKLWISF